MVRDRELGVSEAKVVVVVPERNSAYRKRVTSLWFEREYPHRTASDIASETLVRPDRGYASISQSSLTESVRRRCEETSLNFHAGEFV